MYATDVLLNVMIVGVSTVFDVRSAFVTFISHD